MNFLKVNSFGRARFLLIGIVMILSACLLNQEPKTKYTLSFSKQYATLSQFDVVVIVIKRASGTALDTLFHGKVDAPAKIDNLEAFHYDGKMATIFISGITSDKLVYLVEKTYNGTAGRTDATMIIVGPGVIPQPPVITVLKAEDGKITVTWSPVFGADSYTLFFGEGGVVNKTSPFFKGALSPFALSGLKNGTLYGITIIAINTNGESGLSNIVSGTPQAL